MRRFIKTMVPDVDSITSTEDIAASDIIIGINGFHMRRKPLGFYRVEYIEKRLVESYRTELGTSLFCEDITHRPHLSV